MNVEYTGRQYEITPAIRKEVESGLAKLRKILRDRFETKVILAVEKHRHKAEITITPRNGPIVGLAQANDMKLAVNLLVLRCKDIEATRRFYERLGLAFVEEKHGTGPQHYAWESDGFVLELYPAAEGQPPDNVRIGFSTHLLADLAGDLRHSSGVNVVKQPYATADRLVMLLQDPDGRKVELSQPLHR